MVEKNIQTKEEEKTIDTEIPDKTAISKEISDLKPEKIITPKEISGTEPEKIHKKDFLGRENLVKNFPRTLNKTTQKVSDEEISNKSQSSKEISGTETLNKTTQKVSDFKIFDLYDLSEIEVEDKGLKSAINLKPKLMLKTQGRNVEKYGQTKVNIVERLINRVGVAGHRGKKHRIILGHSTGKFTKNAQMVLNALKLIEKKTNKNPVAVLVKAVENSSPKDEVTTIEYGGAKYPQAIDISPIRRVNLALRWLTQGASDKAFNKKKSLTQAISEEIIMASEQNGESFAIKKKKESEAQADSAR